MEIRRRRPDGPFRLSSVAVRQRAGDGDRARAGRPRLRRSRRGSRSARRHEAPLAEGRLCRRQRPHRADRAAHFRSVAVAAAAAAARGADRHRLGSAGVGSAAANPDGPARHLFGHRRQSVQRRPPRAPSAPPSARTRCPSWCRATASSAKPATSPAITGASPANAPCSAGKRARSEPRRSHARKADVQRQHQQDVRHRQCRTAEGDERLGVCPRARRRNATAQSNGRDLGL